MWDVGPEQVLISQRSAVGSLSNSYLLKDCVETSNSRYERQVRIKKKFMKSGVWDQSKF